MILKKYPFYEWSEFFNSVIDDLSIKNFNVTNNDENYVISLAVPGLTKNDIEIVIEDDCIEISSKNEKSDNKFDFVQKFNRRYEIPDDSDIENITAKVENGILNVTIPKIVTKKVKKSIKID